MESLQNFDDCYMILMETQPHTMPKSTTIMTGLGIVSIALIYSVPVSSQPIQPDRTLTPHNTVVTPLSPDVYGITGGITSGQNLFHSFREFSVSELGAAIFFNDNPNIGNVIGRVTGSSISAINGLIEAGGTSPNFNLFLLNPNGIVFGPNASLNIGGAFIATTADRLFFQGGEEFSASSPQPPLLTVNVPLGLQFGNNPGPIVVMGSILPGPPPEIPPGNTLALVGGNVSLQDAALVAPDGRIEVGSMAGGGRVGLIPDSGGFQLRYLPDQTLGNIQLESAIIDASGPSGGGSIQLRGNQIAIDNSGIFITPGPDATQGGGEINIHATGLLTIENGSEIQTITSSPVSGADIRLQGQNIRIRDGFFLDSDSAPILTQVAAETEGFGPGGNLAIAADTLEMNNLALIGTETRGLSEGGSLNLQVRQLRLNNSVIATNSLGEGDSGNLTVNATENIHLTGDITALQTENSGGGLAGNLLVNTGELTINDGAKISTFSSSIIPNQLLGNAIIRANQITLEGVSEQGSRSSILSQVAPETMGKGGSIIIETETLQIRDGAAIITTSDQGSLANVGDMVINASDRIEIQGMFNPDQISTGLLSSSQLESTGQAGDITINTNQLTISGDGATIFTATEGSGSAGNISIQTRQLQLNNGAQIIATTLGEGVGGNIDVLAESIQLVGTSPTRENPSGLFTSTGTPDLFGQGTAPAGNIQVRTGQLQILDGARISASSQNQGLGGSLNIIASQGVEFTGTSPDGFFRSGLFAESRSEGEGGNIHLSAPNLRLDNGATITTETASNNGGNISLAIADNITLRRQSTISATAGINSGKGDGGNIDIITKYLFAIPLENSDITANAFLGTGGNIIITARGIFGIEFRPELTPLSDITVSSAFGVDGVVTINNPDADPTQALFELPTGPIDASRLVTLSCLPGSQNNQFIVTGRGGLPPNPTTIHTGETPLEDLGSITLESPNLQGSATIYQDFSTVGNSILVEAQGLVMYSDGRVSLIARSPHASSSSIPWLNPQCRPTIIP